MCDDSPVTTARALSAPVTPSATAPAPAAEVAQDSRRAEPRVTQNATHQLSLQSDDRRYSVGFAGLVQFDVGDYLAVRPRTPGVGPQDLSDGVNARRARIGVSGTAARDWRFAFVYDAGNSQDSTPKGIQTAQVVYAGLPGVAVEIGYSNTFFTLDQATAGADTLFLERATPSNIATGFNTGDNRANVGVRLFGDRYWVGGYLTGPASGDSHTLSGERLGAFERAAFQVVSGRNGSAHLGVGVDQLLRAPNAGPGTPDSLTLSDPPELRLDPTPLVNTGALGTAAHPVTGGYVLDVETAATWKGLFWQGEYYRYAVDRRGLDAARFNGGYGQIAWTLTGETHGYNPQAGAYYRIFPAHPFSLERGGVGAIEIAGRVSYLDLTPGVMRGAALSATPDAINGGRQLGYTLGLNWYPNDLLRFMLDYNHVVFGKDNTSATGAVPLGAPVGASLDAISLRSEVVF
ncbi:MAG: porin [Caulobacteraceae bacterium]|nr:porin [Caulobacter sp.]